MITVAEARQILQNLLKPGRVEMRELYDCNGYVLATDIVSQYNIPAFDNSAMDGYALNLDNWDGVAGFKIIGESAAGDHVQMHLKPGEAMRIFTGAMVPLGANAVLMQEKARIENQILYCEDEKIAPGMHIRLEGSQTEKGDTVLQKGHRLHPGSIGFIASLGLDKVEVYTRPEIKIIVTGKEIIKPGKTILPGQVFECNSYSLYTALAALGIDAEIRICGDNLDEISDTISETLETADMLLITGGISVGDYDFVLPALQKNGVEELFYKVKQKPAKPLFLGAKNGKPVFGLPGNPGSVLTSFYVYVLPLIKALCGASSALQYKQARLQSDLHKKAGLTHFVKGYLSDKDVEVLPGQESYRMDAFAFANCLIEIPSEIEFLPAGSDVTIIPF